MMWRKDYIWSNEELRSRLKRYYGIINGTYYAKYLIAKTIPAQITTDESLSTLWDEHSRLSDYFGHYLHKIDSALLNIDLKNLPTFSYLDLKIEIAKRILEKCEFCEFRCGVNRFNENSGVCKLNYESRVSSAFLHPGEEEPLVPSGTIFFSSCMFKCVFCQNYDISTNPNAGQVVSPRQLASIANSLAHEGALNINYVGGDPIPNTYTILTSLKYQTENITQLWNSNLYCSTETMHLLFDVIDLWLPDFKYGNNVCGLKYSRVPKYYDIISRNLKMISDHGDEIIIRHLVLPNHLECCTFPILNFISEHIPNALVNIMGQYRPEHIVRRNPERFLEISRRPTRSEMDRAFQYADQLGIVWRPVS